MAPPSDLLVRFQDVHKTYDGEAFAVAALDLEIRRGEFLTLLGPSGSGKTTTLLLLAGFETPTRGDIIVNGASIVDTPPHRRNFGVVFQNYALFPHMSVRENVAFPLEVRGIPAADAQSRAERALELVQLAGFARRRPHQISGGQQQRTALARALVFEPTLVLLDEPLGALDKKLREQMQIELKQLHERLGNTMISVTHDQSEALTMSDRIAVFDYGRLQQIGAPREVYDRPRNSFVARFVGETNLANGRVASVSGAECRVTLETGETVVASTGAGVSASDRTSLILRPERLALDPPPGQHVNRFGATVRDIVYGGDHVRCILDAFGRRDWSVKVADPAVATALAPGRRVEIAWHARDCLALDPAEG